MAETPKPLLLLVDDEPNVLQGYRRSLRGHFDLETVVSGEHALALLAAGHRYAVLVSDMRMPGMDGLTLLRKAKTLAPDTVRVMITGNTDQQTAVDALNEGDIFRFLAKPCDPAQLVRMLSDAAAQHRLITAERELLEKTLVGAVNALGSALGLVNPEAFGRLDRLEALLLAIGPAVGYEATWQLPLLARLSQLGGLVLPEGLLAKVGRGQAMNEEERQIFEMHPNVAANLVDKIPRLEDIAAAIRYQLKNFDGSGVPHDKLAGEALPLGARLLRLLLDFIAEEGRGLDPHDVLRHLHERRGRHDPRLMQALAAHLGLDDPHRIARLSIGMLAPGMVLARDLLGVDGQLMLCKGQSLSETSRERLLHHLAGGVLVDGVDVYVS